MTPRWPGEPAFARKTRLGAAVPVAEKTLGNFAADPGTRWSGIRSGWIPHKSPMKMALPPIPKPRILSTFPGEADGVTERWQSMLYIETI